MNTWMRRVAVATTLLAGCTGKVTDPGIGAGDGTGGPPGGSGSGNSVGTTATGGAKGPGSGSGGSTGTASGGIVGTTGTGGAPVDPTVCFPGVPGTSQMPRLTHEQYDNTVRDLLQLDGAPSAMLAPDGPGSVDQRAWDGYQAAAATLAPQVLTNATSRAKVITCTPSGDGSACAKTVIQAFGQRVFRRPLTPDEITRFTALYTDRMNITATGTFDEAMQVILQTFLQSPSFLTRSETSLTAKDKYYVLNSWEVASRLSYMIWGSMPDDMLFAKAQTGSLMTTDGILTEAKRLLQDPKARARVSSFHEQYALMGTATRWSEISHDKTVYPAFTQAMVPLFTDETKRFFDYITFEANGSFKDLITTPVAFVNRDLAPIYGLDPAKYGTELEKVDLDPAQRAGVLTHAGFLASYSSYERTSPILRGAFIEKQVLCRTIGSPPPGAINAPLPATGTTNREKVAAQTSGADCAGCHQGIVNPAGFALEAYDGIGAYQTKEKVSGATVDSTADVMIGANTVHVTGPVELMKKIADSTEAQNCYAQRWVKYAYERELTSQDVCTAQGLTQKMTAGGYTVLNLIQDLTQTDSFRYRATE